MKGEIRMLCPYCQQEMKKGYIPPNREIRWFSGEANSETFFVKKKTSVLLAHFLRSPDEALTAYLCENCHKVIIDYK